MLIKQEHNKSRTSKTSFCSLGYSMSSRPVWTRQWDTVLTQKIKSARDIACLACTGSWDWPIESTRQKGDGQTHRQTRETDTERRTEMPRSEQNLQRETKDRLAPSDLMFLFILPSNSFSYTEAYKGHTNRTSRAGMDVWWTQWSSMSTLYYLWVGMDWPIWQMLNNPKWHFVDALKQGLHTGFKSGNEMH